MKRLLLIPVAAVVLPALSSAQDTPKPGADPFVAGGGAPAAEVVTEEDIAPNNRLFQLETRWECFSLPRLEAAKLLDRLKTPAERYEFLAAESKKDGDVTLEILTVLPVKSGTRCKTESISEISYDPVPIPPQGGTPESAARSVPRVQKTVVSGFTVEVEATVGVNGTAVGFTAAPELVLFEGWQLEGQPDGHAPYLYDSRKPGLSGPGTFVGNRNPVTRTRRMQSQFVARPGVPFLLGTFNPSPPRNDAGDPEEADKATESRVWLLFVTATLF